MRGKARSPDIKSEVDRITPAYAGKSLHQLHKLHRKRDHPRLCGEKYRSRSFSVIFGGSPPPMRGKVAHRAKHHAAEGITPAYAGKSRKWTGTRRRTWDHPRLCGEKRLAPAFSSLVMGSPPPMRGKVHCFGNVKDQVGITPAYAGKSHFVQQDMVCT